MQLKRFRVTKFRSVDDSDWITATDITALIGTNESGKTNLIVPLWKLNPAGESGEIDLIADAPRNIYNDIRDSGKTQVFIKAEFELTDDLVRTISNITSRPKEQLKTVTVQRRYNGKYILEFLDDTPERHKNSDEIRPYLEAALKEINNLTPLESEANLKTDMLDKITLALNKLPAGQLIDESDLEQIQADLTQVNTDNVDDTSMIVPCFKALLNRLAKFKNEISIKHAHDHEDVKKLIIEHLPRFVYYSNYGNLDSEIYLPHVIDNMTREGLGSKETAKARTLKVLFQFVKLKPSEIRELGNQVQNPNQDQIDTATRNKKERDILLQSASSKLTAEFRNWWKQGNYRFRFQADGDHFRIWVSDDKRPDDIELEARSTGLQWFLSFYLIFLVESEAAHAGAILLLDEPGLSLHPLAQKDLSAFFENLSKTNQILYTTHSPFLVDPDHLDRVKAVYIKDDGTTGVSSNLRAKEKNTPQSKSIYPVHAALGLSVSNIMLVGSQPIIVEGPSDQLYFSIMKTLLIAAGKITPSLEIVFVPSGGVKGVKALAAILSTQDSELPIVFLDADSSGLKFAADLKASLYSAHKDRVLDVSHYLKVTNAEVEDLLPIDILKKILDRMFQGKEEYFSDTYKTGMPIIGQIESYAKTNSITLETGWKVELAKEVKSRLLKAGHTTISSDSLNIWKNIFDDVLKINLKN